MPIGNPTPATPAQIAMYGHIAAMLRAYLKRTDQDIAAINKAIGKERSYSGPYVWLNCKGGPGPDNRVKLAKLLDCQPDDLAAKVRGKAPDKPVVPVPDRWIDAGPARAAPAGPRRADALSFVVTAQGEAHIKLDVTLPLAEGSALLRMILDAGVVFSTSDGT
jgi:hypothetical protein